LRARDDEGASSLGIEGVGHFLRRMGNFMVKAALIAVFVLGWLRAIER